MVEPPQVRIRVEPAERFAVEGPGAERVAAFAELWKQSWRRADLPACRVVVEELPPMHTGLGVGTQLGLSVASGLNAFSGLTVPAATDLAGSVRRGLRSAVGTHGFLHGGLIFEHGKGAGESLGGLSQREVIPAAWRFVVVVPSRQEGISGEAENRAFARLPEVDAAVARQLLREARERLLPAARSGDFAEFSASLHRFGYTAGLSFAQVQGGAYNGARLTSLVDCIRHLGVEGVGQSSWGPAIFAVTANPLDADRLVASLRCQPLAGDAAIWIAAPRNEGATIVCQY